MLPRSDCRAGSTAFLSEALRDCKHVQWYLDGQIESRVGAVSFGGVTTRHLKLVRILAVSLARHNVYARVRDGGAVDRIVFRVLEQGDE